MTTTRRKRTRAGTTEIADEQLVDIAELGPPPRATVAVHDASSEQVAIARATIAALGHRHAGGGAGPTAVQRVLEMMRAPDGPAVILLGLPGGEPIIDAARALAPRRPVLIAAIDGIAASAADRAHAAGADLATRRPHDAERLGPTLMAAATLADARARVLQLQGETAQLRSRLERLDEVDTATGFQTLEVWKRTLEVELKRARRYGYPLSVCQLILLRGDPPAPPPIGNELHVRAASAVREAIRDIDFPVELTDDRFLVLLPYTDVDGAAHVARRIVERVRDAKPVRAGGRSFTAAVACGVAGVAAGAPVSMGQLMKDAGDALRTAQKRGVDLVVAS